MDTPAIRWLLIGLVSAAVMPRPAAADVAVCVSRVELKKFDKKATDEEKLKLVNSALKNLLRNELRGVHEVLTEANNYLKPRLPLRFGQEDGCTPLTVLIRTSTDSIDAELLYVHKEGKQKEEKEETLYQLGSIESKWQFAQAMDGDLLRTLVYDVLRAAGRSWPAINKELLVRLVSDESQAINLSPLKLPKGSVAWCVGSESCAVLPKLTLNDYLLSSLFTLSIELEGDSAARPVDSLGLSICKPYGTTTDLGIVVRHEVKDLPELPWGHVSFSLKTVNLPPAGMSCQGLVKAPVSQTAPRGAQ